MTGPPDDGPTKVESEDQIRASLDGAVQTSGPKLLIIGGNNRGREYPIGTQDVTIGRGVDNGVILADIAVSRKHTIICLEGNQYVMRDLGSGNGSLLNGRRVESHVLRDGDQLELGNTLMRFINPVSSSAVALAQEETAIADHRGAPLPAPAQAPARGSRRQPTELAVPHKRPKKVTGSARMQGSGVLATRSRKLLVFGSITLVVLFGGMLVLKKVLSAQKKQQASSGQNVRSPDEVAAQEFQEGTTEYRARNWEKARTHFLKVLTLAPSFNQAKRYADQAAMEISSRDALQRSKNSLGAKDYKTSRQELAKIPSTSVYATELQQQKQKVDDAELSELMAKAQALKEAEDIEGALKQVELARNIAPTNKAVRDLYAELDQGGDGTKPEAASKRASSSRKVASRTTSRSPSSRSRSRTRTPSRSRSPSSKTSSSRSTRSTGPSVRISGSGAKQAIAYYKERQWGPAFQSIKAYANSTSGRKKKKAEILADIIRKVGQNWIRAERASATATVMKYYQQAMVYDRKLNKRGYHQKELKGKLFSAARREATQALSRRQYTSAYTAYKLAKKYGPEDALLRKVMVSLGKKAQELFTKGYTKRQSNIAYARKQWQQVLKMVPPSNPAYQKAYTWLNNSTPAYQDEDED